MRDNAKVQQALAAVTAAAEASKTRAKGQKRAANEPNMLAAAIEAARARATVGEISDALEKVTRCFLVNSPTRPTCD